MSVTVVTCVYGNHARFVPAWLEAIRNLDPAPHETIVASDQPLRLPADVLSLVAPCNWRHPQAFYLNLAIAAARTEWVWICDVDDLAFPDALAGLEQVWVDVWQTGYQLGDGSLRSYPVPQMNSRGYLEQDGNPFCGSSAVRVDAFERVGGFRDVAFQDWDLWRRMAMDGAGFQSSGRTHFLYRRHPETRSSVELTANRRVEHIAEMLDSEVANVA